MPLTEVRVLHLGGGQLKLLLAAVSAGYDYGTFQRDLRFMDRRLEEITAPGDFGQVAYQVLDKAERQGWLRELLDMLKKSEFPEVAVIADRTLAECLLMQEASAVSGSGGAPPNTPAVESGTAAETSDIWTLGDPYFSHVIGQQPFIDRSALRLHFKDLLSESASRVLVITGDRPCGKSYTWFFIRQPELLAGVTPVLVDLSEWKEPGTPIEVMSSIALQLGLSEPTIDKHAQEAAQARRLRDWLVGQLQQHDRDGRWLLVFDSLDHVGQREETLQLIEFLAGAAIYQRLAGLRVILLGYANRLLIDPLDAVLTEEIRDIGEAELRDFFRLLARQANEPISDDAIDVVVHWVLSILPPEREPKLRQLPRTVREVGNAAFGRKVLL